MSYEVFVWEQAVAVLGSKRLASRWLWTACGVLGGKPGEIAQDFEGMRRVLMHLYTNGSRERG